ncbi:MAG: GNAT family N-acetyltransferase [Oscillospiraceae bacterium]
MAKSGTVKQVISPDEKEAICRDMLETLPGWFGAGAEDEFAANCRVVPVWASYDEELAREDSGAIVGLQGFLALRETSPYAAEIYIMGVKKEYQRHKVGKNLFTAMLNYARRQGYEYLQVKTIKQGLYADSDSANTFYKSLGFRELEVLPIWGDKNLCQVYIRNVNF